MSVVMKEKEVNERNRQGVLMKEYFDKRREVYEARLEKFLKMYPYNGGRNGADLRRFGMAVMEADLLQKNAILQAFRQEKDYWNSAYVVNNCNCSTHAHIVSTLKAMETILTGMGYSYSNSAQKNKQPLGESSAAKKSLSTASSSAKTPTDVNHWGRAGEDAVEYILKWLPDMYCVIRKDCQGKYDDNVIILENDSFMDESQEFDHLVIGPQGVFNIETKNYAGKLAIDQNGNWFRIKKGETEWVPEENPAQQLFRHHVLLQSIVGDHVPIIDVICMAHPNLMITGQGNSLIPVVKKDLLADFIVNYRTVGLSEREITSICNKINACKVNK
ncbi:MAG: NERD domain-containing protein [Lachnospiraceae bacterium]|nr:NERD domain-containing protein [Lachnospiraceae bacterium]